MALSHALPAKAGTISTRTGFAPGMDRGAARVAGLNVLVRAAEESLGNTSTKLPLERL